MRVRVTISSLVALVLIVGCKADTSWKQDCGALVQRMTDLASTAEGKNDDRGFGDQFKGQEVIWALRFESIRESDTGEESLVFDVGPCGIRHEFFSGNPVMLEFKPAAGTSEIWKDTPSGSQLTISGVVTDVFFATMSPGDNPSKSVPIAAVSLEAVKRVHE